MISGDAIIAEQSLFRGEVIRVIVPLLASRKPIENGLGVETSPL
jgi:hypothetical protein